MLDPYSTSEQHCGFTYISPVAVAIASILQESNNFSPVRTHYDDFSPVFGDAVLERHHGKLTEMGGFIDTLSEAGVLILEEGHRRLPSAKPDPRGPRIRRMQDSPIGSIGSRRVTGRQ